MTKLISGRVKKTPSANVSASRYEFIRLSETEPDLGLPVANGYILTANVDGTRQWILPSTVATTANVANTVSTLSNFTTANLAEGSNLYFTNTRSYANLTAASINALADVDTVTLAPGLGYGLIWNGTNWVPNVITVSSTELSNVANTILGIVQSSLVANTAFFAANANFANIALTANVANTVLSISNFTTSNLAEGSNLYYTNARVESYVNPKLTTANVVELNNLYYTNARVYSNVITALPTYSGNIGAGNVTIGSGTGGSLIGANLISAVNIAATNWIGLYSANVIESQNALYYTNARVYANVSPLLNLKANVADLTTSNVIEGTNLYYTNARVRSALSGGTGVTYDNTTGQISIGQNVSTSSNVTFEGLNVTGPVNFYGNVTTHSSNNLSISDNMIYLNNGSPSANPDLGIAFNYNDGVYHNAGFFRDATDGTFKVFDNYDPAPDANIFINTAHASFRLANLSATTLFGNVQGTVSTLSNFTTSNLAEGTNKYFSNALARNALSAGDATIIYDPTTGTIRATANVTATIENTVNNLSTANVTETAGNLYYTNARVYSNVIALLPTYTGNISAGNIIANTIITGTGSGGSFTGANLISAGNISSTTWLNLYTANVIETSGNLYFTNARVVSALSAGSGISISGNGQISSTTTLNASSVVGLNTANVSESNSNLYYTNARVLSNVTAFLAANPQGSQFANANVASFLSTYTGNISAGNVIANSFVSTAPGTGTLTATGDFNIVSGGNIRLTGNVFANTFISTATGAGSLTSTTDFNINAASNVNITSSNINLNSNSVVTAGNISVNRISATIWQNLYTANVIETSGNLYFTNARVFANVNPLLNAKANVTDLTTANVAELNNLYYTNSRVYSNVIALLPTLAGDNISIAANGRISATVSVSVNAANIVGLTTANVTESNSNLYYTNARVLSNVIAALPTYTGNINAGNIFANIFIAGQGLGGSITGANLISANNISASVITANTIIGGGSGGSVTGANLISTNNISSLNWIGLYTANVIETSGNLYFTNARVQSNVIGFLPSLAGDNITIAANGRISATASATVNVLSIVGLTTANVSESNSNLYYTNARVLSNVTAYLAANPITSSYGNANVGAFLTTYTGNINAGNINANAIIAGQGLGGSITGANLISANNISASVITANTIIGGGSGGSITGANLISTNNISSVNWIGLYTANVIETSGNLYFTNARVVSALSAGSGISISGNGQISSTATITASSVTGLNTANVNEFGSNLYYTNARVLSNVTAYLAANPVISTYGNANVGAFLTTYTGNINAGNVIANSFISTAPGTGTLTATGDFNIVAGGNIRLTGNVFANTFISTATGTGSITSTSEFNINAASNVNITAGNINLNSNNIVTAGNITANRISATIWQNLYTANVIETSGNLYFTNARVQSNVIALLPSLAGDNITIAANGRISATASATVNVLTIVGLTTANVSESNSNLYYTNARVLSNVLALLPTYTGNINAGNVIANSFVAATTGTGTLTATGDFNIVSGGNIRLTGNIFANTFISTATGTGSITSTSDFNINAASNVNITAANINLNSNNIVTTGNITASKFFGDGSSLTGVGASSFTGNTNGITEGTNNLYYTNTRVYSNIIALLPTLAGNNITIEANGRISANVSATVFATAIVGLTTANVTEVGSNLYFTNTRVVSALSAGEGITLSANGQISGGVHAITDSQTFAGGNANITLGTSVSLARRIIVTIDGLVQIPITDYTVSGTILTLIPTPSPNSTIEVKFFGNEAITTQTFNPFLLAGL